MSVATYRVVSADGLTIIDQSYVQGATVSLSDAQAKYLVSAGIIAPLSLPFTPTAPAPTPSIPAPVTPDVVPSTPTPVLREVLALYRVIVPDGLYIVDVPYAQGAFLALNPAQAKYLVAAGLIAPVGDTPPIVAPTPIPDVDTNTYLTITVSGVQKRITIAELIALFPALRGEKGEPGAPGERGPPGAASDPVVVNGHPGPIIVLTASDLGLGNVANLAPRDLPVPDSVASALNLKIDKNKAGVVNGIATLGPDGKVPSSQISPTSTTVITAIDGGIY